MAADLTAAGRSPYGDSGLPQAIEDETIIRPVDRALASTPVPQLFAAPEATVPPEAAVTTEQITCPECGTTSRVVLNQRDARDFCRTCDYPLFWVPTRTPLVRSGSDAASLRRLPGTLGRATVASLECPHCGEPNAVTGELCVRCGLDLHPAPPPPVPEPVAVEPEPEPEPEPDSWPWWAWALMLLVALTAVTAVLYLGFFQG